MKLLIITQKIDINDDLLGFMHGWVSELARHCEKITVIALGVGEYDLPANVKVLSLGKENGRSKIKYLWRFYKYIIGERKNYDTVFVHMNPEYVVLGGWFWKLLRKKISLWYAHGFVPLSLKIAEKFVDIIFSSTKTGCRLVSPKIKTVGQGVDLNKFKPGNKKANKKFQLLALGRISPIKDYETLINAAERLIKNDSINLDVKIIGGPATKSDKKYFEKLKKEVSDRELNDGIRFLGPAPFRGVERFFAEADLMVNPSLTGSLDKTMVEAMACGVPVLSCNESLREILNNELLLFAKGDSYELSQKIKIFFEMDSNTREAIGLQLRSIVEQEHSQEKLINKIVNLLK